MTSKYLCLAQTQCSLVHPLQYHLIYSSARTSHLQLFTVSHIPRNTLQTFICGTALAPICCCHLNLPHFTLLLHKLFSCTTQCLKAVDEPRNTMTNSTSCKIKSKQNKNKKSPQTQQQKQTKTGQPPTYLISS